MTVGEKGDARQLLGEELAGRKRCSAEIRAAWRVAAFSTRTPYLGLLLVATAPHLVSRRTCLRLNRRTPPTPTLIGIDGRISSEVVASSSPLISSTSASATLLVR